MKKHLCMFAVTLGLSALIGSSPLAAMDSKAAIATIPFTFEVGKVQLTAGDYRTSLRSGGFIMQLENLKTCHSILLPGSGVSSGKSTESRLVFHKYGNRYFLAEVWFQDENAGHMVAKSKYEKEMAQAAGSPQVIYLAMR